MGLGMALIVLGILIFMDRIGAGYGMREGWPWIIISLGLGGLFRNKKSLPGWITMIIGVFIIGAKYYSIHISIPSIIKTFFLPVLLIIIGLIWILRYKKD